MNPGHKQLWHEARGNAAPAYNNGLVLVRAAVEEIGRVLVQEHPEGEWERDALHRGVYEGQEGLFVFRLHGQSWTQILYHCEWQQIVYHADVTQRQFLLRDDYPQLLSRRLSARAIAYSTSDTVCSTSYSLFENGELLEAFAADSEQCVRLESRIRSITKDEVGNVWRFLDQFFKDEDALEPGLTSASLVTYCRWAFAVPRPEFESLAYLLVRL